MSQKDSLLDGLMKGLGRRLGTRRRDVHQAIERFNEELHKDETSHPDTAGATAVPDEPATPSGADQDTDAAAG